MIQVYRFGNFEADLVTKQLRCGPELVPITPKVFQTLEMLLRNHDRIVTKQELLTGIWPDCHVEEANLTQNISVLRKTLGVSNSGIQFIATFPRQGYRFIGEAVERRTETVVRESPAIKRHFAWSWLVAAALITITVIAGAGRLHRNPFPRERIGSVLGAERPITHLPGRQYQPALSPDGTRVVFVSHQDLNAVLRMAVLDITPHSKPRFIDSGGGDAFSPAWSPDGRRLAYLLARNGTVTVVLQELEGMPETLTEIFPESCGIVARRLDWSPDGNFLAVSSKSAAAEPFRIELIHITSRTRTVLTTPPQLSDGDFQPRFSPDGAKLAFVRMRDLATMEAMYITIPSGDPIPVNDKKQPIGDVDWTPDSASILFTTQHGRNSDVHRVSIASGAKTEEFLAQVDASVGPVQFSASRRTGTLAWAHAQPDENIWRATFTRSHKIASWERLIASHRLDFSPVYSSDSHRIAFLSDRTGDQQLWIREPDGRERQITFGALKPGAPSWTAKSDVIVFPSLRQRVLFKMPVERGEPAAIPIGTVGAHTAVSPGGDLVYFVRRFLIMQAPSSGGEPRQVTDEGGFPLRLSPDGNWIYFVRHRYSGEIWRLSRSSGAAERVTDRLRLGCWACWSVNKNALVYVSAGDTGSPLLERIELATGKLYDLGRIPGRLPPLGFGMITLAPDDTTLAVVVAEPGTGNIEVAETTPWSNPDTRVLASRR